MYARSIVDCSEQGRQLSDVMLFSGRPGLEKGERITTCLDVVHACEVQFVKCAASSSLHILYI